MAGYTRQSSSEIVDGQVAFASDFNNEFNALATTFGTNGHTHDGSNGNGPKLDLTTSVTNVLAASNGGVTSTNADPTTSNGGASYAVGSIWVNTSNKTIYWCASNGASTAIWVRANGVASNAAPATTDDVNKGYNRGSIWVHTGLTPNVPYICLDNTASAAVWVAIVRGRTGIFASNPSVSDDATKGYQAGSFWIQSGQPWVCVDSSNGGAVWYNVALGRTIASNANPTSSDNLSLGFTVGSIWVNASNQDVFVCVNSSNSSATWQSNTTTVVQGVANQTLVTSSGSTYTVGLASNVTVANNLTSTGNFTASSNVTINGTLRLFEAVESVAATNGSLTGTINFDVLTGAVLYHSSNAASNWILNVRGDSSTTLNSMLSTNESVTVAHIITNGSSAKYVSSVTIDGGAVTPKWVGGTPTEGTASGVDVYTYTIIKTGTSTYLVIASRTGAT